MSPHDHVQRALVGFWRHGPGPDAMVFVGNGVFVAPGRVLTAAHVVYQDDGDAIRDLLIRHTDQPLVTHRVEAVEGCPSGGDVALVRVPVLPTATCLELDGSEKFDDGQALVFRAHLGKWLPARDMSVTLTPEAGPEHWVVNGTFEPGHSGSGVRNGRKLVAIAVRRQGEQRGHIVPVNHFRPWLDGLLGERIRPQKSLIDRFAECFASEGFVACRTRERDDPLPTELQGAFDLPLEGEKLANACLDAVLQITAKLTRTRPALAAPYVGELEDGLMRAMGLAVLLTLNPAALASATRTDGIVIEVGANYDVTAMLTLLREHAWRSWSYKRMGETDSSQVNDVRCRNVLSIGERDLGVGESERESFTRIVADWILPPTEAAFLETRSPADRLKSLANYLDSERRKAGHGHYLLVNGSWRDELRRAALDWVFEKFKLQPIAFVTPPETLFLVPEDELVSAIGSFLFELEQPFWKPTST